MDTIQWRVGRCVGKIAHEGVNGWRVNSTMNKFVVPYRLTPFARFAPHHRPLFGVYQYALDANLAVESVDFNILFVVSKLSVVDDILLNIKHSLCNSPPLATDMSKGDGMFFVYVGKDFQNELGSGVSAF